MTGLELIAGVMTAASGVMGAIGAVQSGNAQAASAKYTAQQADRNARIARDQAEADAADQRRENSRQMGAIRAAYGASGVEMAGSPLDVLADTAAEQELDVSRIKYQGELRAMGEIDRAALARAEAKNAKTAGTIGAISSITRAGASLMGSPSVKSKW